MPKAFRTARDSAWEQHTTKIELFPYPTIYEGITIKHWYNPLSRQTAYVMPEAFRLTQAWISEQLEKRARKKVLVYDDNDASPEEKLMQSRDIDSRTQAAIEYR